MAYTKHNFADGNVLSASQLNEMEDGISANDAAKHTHANKAVLDGITAGKVSGWDGLQSQVDAIVSKSDVVDIVGTKAALNAYDTSSLIDKDVVAVLADETHDGAKTFYRWTVSGGIGGWVYIGSEGATYTKDEIQQMFSGVARIPVITAAASQLTAIELDEDDEDILTGIDLTAEQQTIIEDGTVAALIIDLTALGHGRYFYTKYASTRPNDMAYGQFMGTMLFSEAGVFSTSENRSISFVYNEAFSTYGTLIFTTKHIGTESGGGTSDIYHCVYGTTTLAQIQAAVAAGQLPVCEYGDIYYVYVGMSNGYACFSTIITDVARRLYVKSTWGSASYTIAKAADIPTVPTALSQLSDDVGIAGLKAKIDYLYPYIKGQEWAFTPDTTAAYSKQVPAGAKMGCVNKIGGASFKWNQLWSDPRSFTASWGIASVTESDGVYTLTSKTTGMTGLGFADLKAPAIIETGHIYIVSADVGEVSGFAFPDEYYFNVGGRGTPSVQSQGRCTLIIDAATTSTQFRIYVDQTAETQYKFTLGKISLYDLTAMFGAGNEPMTVEAAEAAMSSYGISFADYHPYHAASVVNADVSKVEWVAENGVNIEQEIPATVQALPGYGMGNASAHNSIERTDDGWEYVQRVEANPTPGELPVNLATVVHTDITAQMANRLDPVAVGSGTDISSVRFVSSLGSIVPNKVEYMINIEEALS